MAESLKKKRSRDGLPLSSGKRRKTADETSSHQHNLKLPPSINISQTSSEQHNLKLPIKKSETSSEQNLKLAREFGECRQNLPQVVDVAAENFQLLHAQYLLAAEENEEEEEEVKEIDGEEFNKSVNRYRQLQRLRTLPSASALTSSSRLQRMQQCHVPSTSTSSRSRNGENNKMLRSFNKWLSSSWRKQ